ncbi:MAG: hypothetical protein LRS46_00055 [Desulfurococcales archaeon]|nr:hypothetical protein [Desulfurococcales archaeon]
MTSKPVTASQKLPREPVDAAIIVASSFSRAFENNCKESASAVSRRLKEFPQISLQAGLTPALTFYASKLDKEKRWLIFIDALKAVTGGQAGSMLCDETTGEGEGYPHALAILLAYIAERAGCNINALLDYKQVKRGFVQCMEVVRRGGLVLEKIALAYASEVKKLFAALYPTE